MNRQKALEITAKVLDIFNTAIVEREPNSDKYVVKIEKAYFNDTEVWPLQAIVTKEKLIVLFEGNTIIVGI